MRTATIPRPGAVDHGRVAAVAAASPPLAARHFFAKLAFETDPSDLAADLAAGVGGLVVVDTRSPEAYEAAHLPGAINLPHATIGEDLLPRLDPDALHVTYCWGPACNASIRGAANLAALGIRVKELIGGLTAWQAEGFPVEGTQAGSAVAEVACAC
ncbi:MAG TPA: rhodanese-like domain-containing protein [Aquihabitans sp.]|nr:rhodanese-like domain-containing protein [Aquihabitans sp.]